MNTLKLGDTEYRIQKNGVGDFSLIWESATKVKKANPRTGKVSGTPVTWTRYYGSLVQSLCGFVKFYVEDFEGDISIEDIEKRADVAYKVTCNIMDKLSNIDKAIIEEWKVVRVSKG